MTTFKVKNVFLVLGRGHTMNKLTHEYEKMQKLKVLVDSKCKCVRLDTPKIGPIQGFLAVALSKVFLKFLNLKKMTMWGQNQFFVFRPTLLIHWGCETTSVLHVWKGFLPYFMMGQLIALKELPNGSYWSLIPYPGHRKQQQPYSNFWQFWQRNLSKKHVFFNFYHFFRNLPSKLDP